MKKIKPLKSKKKMDQESCFRVFSSFPKYLPRYLEHDPDRELLRWNKTESNQFQKEIELFLTGGMCKPYLSSFLDAIKKKIERAEEILHNAKTEYQRNGTLHIEKVFQMTLDSLELDYSVDAASFLIKIIKLSLSKTIFYFYDIMPWILSSQKYLRPHEYVDLISYIIFDFHSYKTAKVMIEHYDPLPLSLKQRIHIASMIAMVEGNQRLAGNVTMCKNLASIPNGKEYEPLHIEEESKEDEYINYFMFHNPFRSHFSPDVWQTIITSFFLNEYLKWYLQLGEFLSKNETVLFPPERFILEAATLECIWYKEFSFPYLKMEEDNSIYFGISKPLEDDILMKSPTPFFSEFDNVPQHHFPSRRNLSPPPIYSYGLMSFDDEDNRSPDPRSSLEEEIISIIRRGPSPEDKTARSPSPEPLRVRSTRSKKQYINFSSSSSSLSDMDTRGHFKKRKWDGDVPQSKRPRQRI